VGKLIRIHWFIGISSILLFGWAGPAITGAPAPIPASSGPHPEHLVANLGDFKFENGDIVKDFKVSYVTHGKLNRKKDNVILAMQHYFGDHHDYDFLIGPGKALDTNKYFIVATDFIASAGIRQDITTGPTNSGLKMEFPPITGRDWVEADYRLLKEYLGFDRILAVIGGSIGAMNAFQFAVSYPDFARGVIPIAGSPVTNPQVKAMLRSFMNIISLDAGWYNGNYIDNPTVGVTTALMTYIPALTITTQWFAENLKSKEKYRKWEKFFYEYWTIYAPQDARDLYYQTQAWSNYDVGSTPGFDGDVELALRSIKAQVLMIATKIDMSFPIEDVMHYNQFVPNLAYVEYDSPLGHSAFVVDPEMVKFESREIAKFLANLQ
jgi:homoserine O-acetyltransferase